MHFAYQNDNRNVKPPGVTQNFETERAHLPKNIEPTAIDYFSSGIYWKIDVGIS